MQVKKCRRRLAPQWKPTAQKQKAKKWRRRGETSTGLPRETAGFYGAVSIHPVGKSSKGTVGEMGVDHQFSHSAAAMLSFPRGKPDGKDARRAHLKGLARIFHTFVAQTSSLLNRRASSLHCARPHERGRLATACRLETGDTAGWKAALRGRAVEPHTTICEISGLDEPPARASVLFHPSVADFPRDHAGILSRKVSIPIEAGPVMCAADHRDANPSVLRRIEECPTHAR